MSQEESHVVNAWNLTASQRILKGETELLTDRELINYLLIFIRKIFSQVALQNGRLKDLCFS